VLEDAWQANVLGQPLPLVIFASLALVTFVVVHHTVIGRMIYAVGDNAVAARFAGIPVRRLTFGLYAASGLAAGLCGAADVMHYRAAAVEVHKTLELTAIACVVLGGVRVTGGHGHVAGTLLGIVTVIALVDGLRTVWPTGRDMALGALLVVVAAGNEAARRAAAARPVD
jgi:ribose/xylose/arabinose/galactoside ABC-type transport system permease subunit